MPQSFVEEKAPDVSAGAHSSAFGTGSEFRAPLECLLAAITTTGAARAATLRIFSSHDSGLHLLGAARVPKEFRERLDVMDGRCGACGDAAQRNLEVCRDAACKCVQLLDDREEPVSRLRAIPLHHGDHACGVLTLFGCSDRDVHPDLFAMLPALSELLGIALEHCRMSEEKLLASLTQERHLLANEIHDALAQNLASARMRTSLLRHAVQAQDSRRADAYLGEIDDSLSVAHARVRELITHFRTEMDARGLLPALESTINELAELGGIRIVFNNRVRALDLNADQEIQVFYIVREALTNAVKHSGANHVSVSLARWSDRYEIEVEDNGVGIEEHDSGQHGHFGLNIMRERAHRIGGEVVLESLPGRGTRVRLSFPAPSPDPEVAA